MHEGSPSVNFNPVMQKPLPIDEAHPAVSNRQYRLIAAAVADAGWRRRR
jgi:hypothetical protein